MNRRSEYFVTPMSDGRLRVSWLGGREGTRTLGRVETEAEADALITADLADRKQKAATP